MSRNTVIWGIAAAVAAVAATASTAAATVPTAAVHHAAAHALARHSAAAPAATHAADPSTASLASGVFDDGTAYSVTLESYHGVPASFAGDYPGTIGAGDHVLCERMVIGGRLIDAQGGPWADCTLVTAGVPSVDTGLFGFTDKGTDGDRVLIGLPEAGVTRVVVELNDHNSRSTHVVTVPRTTDRGWAFGLSNGETIAAIDTYNAAGDLVGRDTDFH